MSGAVGSIPSFTRSGRPSYAGLPQPLQQRPLGERVDGPPGELPGDLLEVRTSPLSGARGGLNLVSHERPNAILSRSRGSILRAWRAASNTSGAAAQGTVLALQVSLPNA